MKKIKLEDIKTGMIVVTRNNRVYIVFRDSNGDPYGVRGYGWFSLYNRQNTPEWDIVEVYDLKDDPVVLIDIIKRLGTCGDNQDVGTISMLHSGGHRPIMEALPILTKKDLIKIVGFDFDIIEE